MEARVEDAPLETLRLSEMLLKRRFVSFDELWDVLSEQQCSDMRIGDIAVDVFRIVSREQVEETPAMQASPLE